MQMPKLVLPGAIALSLVAGPLLAGGFGYTTPTLTWPKPASTVTQNCLPTAPVGATPALNCAQAE